MYHYKSWQLSVSHYKLREILPVPYLLWKATVKINWIVSAWNIYDLENLLLKNDILLGKNNESYVEMRKNFSKNDLCIDF